MFAGRQHVLEMKIRRPQCIQRRKVGAMPLVKPANLVPGVAGAGFNELDPTMAPAVDDLEDVKRRVIATLVQPGQKLLKVDGVQSVE